MEYITNRTFIGDGLYIKNPSYVSGCKFFNIKGDNHHGIEITGPGCKCSEPFAVIENCVIDNSGVKADDYDEGCALFNGARVVFNRVRFKHLGKACLIGNGDQPEIDIDIEVEFNNCIFEENSRRNPYVQYGHVILNNCLIKNWGDPNYYHLKSHGLRVGDLGNCEVNNCVFWQDKLFPGFKNFLSDITSQYDPILIPGNFRAAYKEGIGKLSLTNCYFNHWYLYRDGKTFGKMPKSDAKDLINRLETEVPKLQ